MRDRFLEAGLDEAKTVPYDVLLSYPRAGVMNTVSLIDERGRINYTTAGRQPPLGSPEEFSEDIMHNFNAFSANGVVEVAPNWTIYVFPFINLIVLHLIIREMLSTSITVARRITSTCCQEELMSLAILPLFDWEQFFEVQRY